MESHGERIKADARQEHLNLHAVLQHQQPQTCLLYTSCLHGRLFFQPPFPFPVYQLGTAYVAGNGLRMVPPSRPAIFLPAVRAHGKDIHGGRLPVIGNPV